MTKPLPTQTVSQSELTDTAIQWAMWADENLFGHGLDDEAYDQACQHAADDIGNEVYEALRERPSR